MNKELNNVFFAMFAGLVLGISLTVLLTTNIVLGLYTCMVLMILAIVAYIYGNR